MQGAQRRSLYHQFDRPAIGPPAGSTLLSDAERVISASAAGWTLCVALLVGYAWAASCLPMLALFVTGPLLPRAVTFWFESPVARLISAATACGYML
jgi:hypothetical protein